MIMKLAHVQNSQVAALLVARKDSAGAQHLDMPVHTIQGGSCRGLLIESKIELNMWDKANIWVRGP